MQPLFVWGFLFFLSRRWVLRRETFTSSPGRPSFYPVHYSSASTRRVSWCLGASGPRFLPALGRPLLSACFWDSVVFVLSPLRPPSKRLKHENSYRRRRGNVNTVHCRLAHRGVHATGESAAPMIHKSILECAKRLIMIL